MQIYLQFIKGKRTENIIKKKKNKENTDYCFDYYIIHKSLLSNVHL